MPEAGILNRTIRIPCDPGALARLRQALKELLEQGGVEPPHISRLVLAVDEAVGTLIGYNHRKGFGQELSVTIEVSPLKFRTVVVDPRCDWDPPACRKDLDWERQHKLAFYLISRLVDEVRYCYVRRKENRLELIKRLGSDGC